MLGSIKSAVCRTTALLIGVGVFVGLTPYSLARLAQLEFAKPTSTGSDEPTPENVEPPPSPPQARRDVSPPEREITSDAEWEVPSVDDFEDPWARPVAHERTWKVTSVDEFENPWQHAPTSTFSSEQILSPPWASLPVPLEDPSSVYDVPKGSDTAEQRADDSSLTPAIEAPQGN